MYEHVIVDPYEDGLTFKILRQGKSISETLKIFYRGSGMSVVLYCLSEMSQNAISYQLRVW